MIINNLKQTDETANQETQKVYFEEEILTIGHEPQWNADRLVSFKEVMGFWQLPDAMLNKKIVPAEGTVVKVTLATKPKAPGPNTKEGSKYMDIGSMTRMPEGTQPTVTAQAQQPAPQAPAADDWGNPAPQAANAASVGDGLTVDEKIKKSQALNLLFDTINATVPLAEKLESLKGMYFDSLEEAKMVAGEQWNNLRLGLTPFTEVAEPAEPADAAEDERQQAHLADQQPEENVEELPW